MIHSIDEIDTKGQEWRADVELEMKFLLKVDDKNVQELRRGGFQPEVSSSQDDFQYRHSPKKGGGGGGGSPAPDDDALDVALRSRFWANKYAAIVAFKNSHDAPLKVAAREVWAPGPIKIVPAPTRTGNYPRSPHGEGGVPADVQVGEEYLVTVCQRVKTRFVQPFKLSSFPFDQQQLRIELLLKDEKFAFASLDEILKLRAFYPPEQPHNGTKKSEAQLEYDEMVGALGSVSYFLPAAYQSPVNTAWDIYKRIGMETGSSWRDESRTLKTYSRCRFIIYASRKYIHLLWQLVFPYMICTISAFLMASIPPDHIGERLQVLMSLLLASVGLRFVLQNYLPDASSDTILENYVQCSITFFLMCGIGCASVASPHINTPIETADKVFWGMLALLWLAGHAHFVATFLRVRPTQPDFAVVNAVFNEPVVVEETEHPWRKQRHALVGEQEGAMDTVNMVTELIRTGLVKEAKDAAATAKLKWETLHLSKAFLESDCSEAIFEPKLQDRKPDKISVQQRETLVDKFSKFSRPTTSTTHVPIGSASPLSESKEGFKPPKTPATRPVA